MITTDPRDTSIIASRDLLQIPLFYNSQDANNVASDLENILGAIDSKNLPAENEFILVRITETHFKATRVTLANQLEPGNISESRKNADTERNGIIRAAAIGAFGEQVNAVGYISKLAQSGNNTPGIPVLIAEHRAGPAWMIKSLNEKNYSLDNDGPSVDKWRKGHSFVISRALDAMLGANPLGYFNSAIAA